MQVARNDGQRPFQTAGKSCQALATAAVFERLSAADWVTPFWMVKTLKIETIRHQAPVKWRRLTDLKEWGGK